MQAAVLFSRDVPLPEIARRLRVSRNALCVWRRRWLTDGEAGLASKGPSGTGCRLSERQPDQLAAALHAASAYYRVGYKNALSIASDAMDELTVINASFNVKNQPTIMTPGLAVEVFATMSLTRLHIEGFRISCAEEMAS